MFEVTVSKVFSAAHAIRLADGSLEPLHGHNWLVDLTVASPKLDEIETVMDFHRLEGLLAGVLAPADNRNLNEVGPFAGGRVNPTAERVAWWIGSDVAKSLPRGVTLVSVRVGEAPGCIATYRP
jgi:6-pyruvoyltetrahydropterin/6-carboxytetrahydropterin synthase